MEYPLSCLFQSYQLTCLLREHENDIESSSGAPERIRIVADENQNEETKVMCKICSQVQEFRVRGLSLVLTCGTFKI